MPLSKTSSSVVSKRIGDPSPTSSSSAPSISSSSSSSLTTSVSTSSTTNGSVISQTTAFSSISIPDQEETAPCLTEEQKDYDAECEFKNYFLSSSSTFSNRSSGSFHLELKNPSSKRSSAHSTATSTRQNHQQEAKSGALHSPQASASRFRNLVSQQQHQYQPELPSEDLIGESQDDSLDSPILTTSRAAKPRTSTNRLSPPDLTSLAAPSPATPCTTHAAAVLSQFSPQLSSQADTFDSEVGSASPVVSPPSPAPDLERAVSQSRHGQKSSDRPLPISSTSVPTFAPLNQSSPTTSNQTYQTPSISLDKTSRGMHDISSSPSISQISVKQQPRESRRGVVGAKSLKDKESRLSKFTSGSSSTPNNTQQDIVGFATGALKSVSSWASNTWGERGSSSSGILGRKLRTSFSESTLSLGDQGSNSNKRVDYGQSFWPLLSPRRGTNMVIGVPLSQAARATRIDAELLPELNGRTVCSSAAVEIENAEAFLHLPALMMRCSASLRMWGRNEEGMLRVSGRSSHITALKADFDGGADIDLIKLDAGDLDPHAVASVFKAFLRSLPEPALTTSLAPEFDMILHSKLGTATYQDGGVMAASSRTQPKPCHEDDESIDGIRGLLSKLPRENFYLLREIVKILRCLASHSKANKMPLSNLLLCLSPSLNLAGGFLHYLVVNADYFWSLDPEPLGLAEDANSTPTEMQFQRLDEVGSNSNSLRSAPSSWRGQDQQGLISEQPQNGGFRKQIKTKRINSLGSFLNISSAASTSSSASPNLNPPTPPVPIRSQSSKDPGFMSSVSFPPESPSLDKANNFKPDSSRVKSSSKVGRVFASFGFKNKSP